MIIGSYILIIAFNVNRLNEPTKRYRLVEWIQKTRPIYMLSTRKPPQIWRHTHTESEEMERAIPCKWKSKESQSCNTSSRHNTL